MENDTVEKTTVTRKVSTPVAGEAVSTETETVAASVPKSEFMVSKTNQVIFAFIGIIALLLLLRFTFLLLGANQVGIVSFILVLTEIFIAPFRGIFPSPSSGEAYFDTASLVAIVIYFVFGFILATIINLFSSRTDREV
jgi:hypothetical protein